MRDTSLAELAEEWKIAKKKVAKIVKKFTRIIKLNEQINKLLEETRILANEITRFGKDDCDTH